MNFGIEKSKTGSRMTIEIPDEVVTDRLTINPAIEAAEKWLQRSRYIDIEHHSDFKKVYVNTKKLGNARTGKAKAINGIVSYVSSVGDTPARMEAVDDSGTNIYYDPKLKVQIGTSYLGTSNRYGMHAEIAWPENKTSDIELSQLATTAMLDTAYSLRHLGSEFKQVLPDLIGAQVVRSEGVVIQTNPIGSCSLGTIGDEYEPEEPTFTVYAHNIYNPEQQLICLAGVIAIAHADDILLA